MCPHCRAFITSKDKICPYCNEKVGPRAVDLHNAGDFLGGLIPAARFNTVTILLINFGLYVATTLYSMRSDNPGGWGSIDGRTLFLFGAKFGPAIVGGGQWWRLVTAGFLHGGMLHILMNSWVLFEQGALVEEVFGPSRMWVIYFAATVGGFFVSTLLHPVALSVGASAGIFGLIGAMLALAITSKSSMALALRGMYMRWIVYGLLFSLLPGIDMGAHICGLVSGFGVAYIAGQPRYVGSPIDQAWRVASWICVALTVLSFLKMYLWFSSGAQ